MKIGVLIPVFNESATIGSIVERLRKKGLDVIVIDDGSIDRSRQIAEQNGAHVIRNEKRNGKGYSLRAGFEFVVKEDYHGIIAMDGDGQHDIDDLDRFLSLAQNQDVHIITGNRLANSEGMPWVRLCTNRFMSWLISLACRQTIPDTQCGYRYLSCYLLKSIHLSSRDYEIESEILMKASKKGYKIYSVPVKTIYAQEESEIKPVKDTFRFFTYFLKEIFNVEK